MFTIKFLILLPPQGFRPEGEILRSTLVTRAYIKERTLQLKYTVSMPEKSRFA